MAHKDSAPSAATTEHPPPPCDGRRRKVRDHRLPADGQKVTFRKRTSYKTAATATAKAPRVCRVYDALYSSRMSDPPACAAWPILRIGRPLILPKARPLPRFKHLVESNYYRGTALRASHHRWHVEHQATAKCQRAELVAGKVSEGRTEWTNQRHRN